MEPEPHLLIAVEFPRNSCSAPLVTRQALENICNHRRIASHGPLTFVFACQLVFHYPDLLDGPEFAKALTELILRVCFVADDEESGHWRLVVLLLSALHGCHPVDCLLLVPNTKSTARFRQHCPKRRRRSRKYLSVTLFSLQHPLLVGYKVMS